MSPSVWQIAIVAVVILVLFGRGRISEMMGDFGKGINSFKKGMSQEEKTSEASEKTSAQIGSSTKDAAATNAKDAKPSDKPE